jgi:RecA-family ATPase
VSAITPEWAYRAAEAIDRWQQREFKKRKPMSADHVRRMALLIQDEAEAPLKAEDERREAAFKDEVRQEVDAEMKGRADDMRAEFKEKADDLEKKFDAVKERIGALADVPGQIEDYFKTFTDAVAAIES